MDIFFASVNVKWEEESGQGGLSEELQRLAQARSQLRVKTARMAAAAGMSAGARSKTHMELAGSGTLDFNINKHGGTHTTTTAAPLKTPKYAGKSDWEAFHAQFELQAVGWTVNNKALQLSMCLTDVALKCLLLLSSEDRHNYDALVGALKRLWTVCAALSA